MKALTHGNPDMLLLGLAEAYRASLVKPKQRRGDFQYRAMLTGRAWRLTQATYRVDANREAVWQEWQRLALVPAECLSSMRGTSA